MENGSLFTTAKVGAKADAERPGIIVYSWQNGRWIGRSAGDAFGEQPCFRIRDHIVLQIDIILRLCRRQLLLQLGCSKKEIRCSMVPFGRALTPVYEQDNPTINRPIRFVLIIFYYVLPEKGFSGNPGTIISSKRQGECIPNPPLRFIAMVFNSDSRVFFTVLTEIPGGRRSRQVSAFLPAHLVKLRCAGRKSRMVPLYHPR